jgi:putative Holliday junction resolvase
MPPTKPAPLTVLGLDYGRRRIGVAVGQTITGTATPVVTLYCHHDSPDWKAIENLIDQWQPQVIVVGTPLTRVNRGHEIQGLIKRLCSRLHDKFALPVHTFNESYTSAEAYRRLKAMRQAGRTKKISKEEIDSLAAAILLESWMASWAITTNLE